LAHLYKQLLERLEAVPGVRSATLRSRQKITVPVMGS
jgi:hypothetical protein